MIYIRELNYQDRIKVLKSENSTLEISSLRIKFSGEGHKFDTSPKVEKLNLKKIQQPKYSILIFQNAFKYSVAENLN